MRRLSKKFKKLLRAAVRIKTNYEYVYKITKSR